MLLINCKVKLKRKWKNHCLEPANGNDNDDTHPNNHIFTMKDFSAKDLTEQFIGMNIKQKVKIKIQQMNRDIFFD